MNKTVAMNSTSISMVTGEITDTIFVHDSELAFGDGIFETMRFENNQLSFLRLHLRCLSSGCESLGIYLDLKKLRNSLTNAVASVVPVSKPDGRNLSNRRVSKKIDHALQKRAFFYAS